MENNEVRLGRVRAQQNFVTALCILCMVFAVGWTVYAAISSGPRTASSNKTNVPKGNEVTAPAQEESSAGEAESAAEETEDSEEAYFADDGDQLQDAVFIGDSRTVGLMNSTDKPQADFLCAVGLNIDSVLTSEDISLGDGSTGTLAQALSGKSYGRVFISFGTNEMGWPYIDVFKEHYTEMAETIRGLQPDAEIYLVGILPVTASQDAKGESVNNENARTFSAAISEVAQAMGVNYLDCSPAVADEYGYLPEEASTDGVHLNSEYCLKWQDFIIANT